MLNETRLLLFALGLLATWFVIRWIRLERYSGTASTRQRPSLLDIALGTVFNFLDALGIGNFATTTAAFKFRRQPADELVPGTLNVGYALPTVTEALIFIGGVHVEITTLVSMIGSAVLGALLGVGVVNRLPRRVIQIGMGVALLIAGGLLFGTNVGLMPGGGASDGLTGGRLALAVVINFALGALNTLGIGLYAPCLILCTLLGMSTLAAFPIMMGACAFLMPAAGIRFIRAKRYSLRSALGLTLGGIPGVLVAAYLVRSLPLLWLRWLVLLVVVYAATLMLLSARGMSRQPPSVPS